MVSMKEMNSAGGFELLTLRREEAPTKTVSMKTLLEHRAFFDEQCAILIDKLKAADDLNIRLAAHIIDLNGKIIELESQLKMQGEMAKAAIEAARAAKPQTLLWDTASIKADDNLREMVARQREMSKPRLSSYPRTQRNTI